jgi:hypothetical protein
VSILLCGVAAGAKRGSAASKSCAGAVWRIVRDRRERLDEWVKLIVRWLDDGTRTYV